MTKTYLRNGIYCLKPVSYRVFVKTDLETYNVDIVIDQTFSNKLITFSDTNNNKNLKQKVNLIN